MQSSGPKICFACARRARDIHHVNGDESDGAPENLAWACRPCNVRIANVMRRAGMGRLTRQNNPASAAGAENLGQWMNAVTSMKGDGGTMAVGDAVAMIRATPPEERSKLTREIWEKRRQRGTDRAVPF